MEEIGQFVKKIEGFPEKLEMLAINLEGQIEELKLDTKEALVDSEEAGVAIVETGDQVSFKPFWWFFNSQAPNVPELAHQGIFQLSRLSVNYVKIMKKYPPHLNLTDFMKILSVPKDHCGSHNKGPAQKNFM